MPGPARSDRRSAGATPARLRPISFCLSALCLGTLSGAARGAPAAEDWTLCARAIAEVEPGAGTPPGLLTAVALVESGRADPATGRPQPWPWAYNAAGEGRLAPDRATAIAEVASLRARGVASVDVGCMQVNLFHHPDAFASLGDGFDPVTNIRYAARFLVSLHAATGDWGAAVARYHSGDPARGAAYGRRVALAALGRAWSGGGRVVLRLEGSCAPRGGGVTVLRGGDAEPGAPVLRVSCRAVRPRAFAAVARASNAPADAAPVAVSLRVARPRRGRR